MLSHRRIADPPVPSAGGRALYSLLLGMDLRITQSPDCAGSSENRLTNCSLDKIIINDKRFISNLTVGFHIQSYIHITIDCVRLNIS